MKYVMIVSESLAQDATEELGNRTPLEIAKVPFLNALAQKGKVGQASFVPNTMKPSRDVACFSMLGYDPARYYTGQAPLDALSFGIDFKDGEIAFCCDFVTVVDGVMTDASASFISPKESSVLITELNDKLGSKHVKFYNGYGHHNILVISTIEKVESLDNVECSPPSEKMGEKYQKGLPRGHESEFLTDLMEKSREILENHEINRVRIDLKENPANMIWLWGQGQRLKAPSFTHKTNGLRGGLLSKTPFANGLAHALEMKLVNDLSRPLDELDFLFVYDGRIENQAIPKDNQSKIKRIEEFDSRIVGELVRILDGHKEEGYRICVIADATYGHAPILIQGTDVLADQIDYFNEKSSSQSPLLFKKGHELIDYLKSEVVKK